MRLESLAKLAYGLSPRRIKRTVHYRLVPSIEHRHLGDLAIDSVLDVGANLGQFSLLAQALWPNCRVCAFEPLAFAADVYEANLTGARLIRAAVGSAVGDANFHVSHRHDSSSLLPIGALQVEMFPGTGVKATETVPLTTLDHSVTDGDVTGVTLLKIDVQGGELEVLAGARRTLESVDFVYVEVSFEELYDGQPLAADVLDVMMNVGFRVDRAANLVVVRGRPIQMDLLFKRKSLQREAKS